MDELSNPRSLPCSHTFCCRCIETWCRQRQRQGRASCPVCNSLFAVPAAGRCSKLPRNVYAEELVRVNRNTGNAELSLQICQNELAALTAQLKANEGVRQRMFEDYDRLKKALSDTNTKLAELEEQSAQLESGIEEVDRNLPAAEHVRKQKQRREVTEEVKRNAEALLAKEKRMCQNMCNQLRQIQRDTSEQLEEAEHRYEAAKIEEETCQRATNDLGASLRDYDNLQPQINSLKADLKKAEGRFFLCFKMNSALYRHC